MLEMLIRSLNDVSFLNPYYNLPYFAWAPSIVLDLSILLQLCGDQNFIQCTAQHFTYIQGIVNTNSPSFEILAMNSGLNRL